MIYQSQSDKGKTVIADLCTVSRVDSGPLLEAGCVLQIVLISRTHGPLVMAMSIGELTMFMGNMLKHSRPLLNDHKRRFP